ncbi:lithostathine-1-beta-like [Arapaima gigas]
MSQVDLRDLTGTVTAPSTSAKMWYLTMFPLILVSTASSGNNTHPPDTVLAVPKIVGNQLYIVLPENNDKMSYTEAQQYCKDHYTGLASVSPADVELLTAAAQKNLSGPILVNSICSFYQNGCSQLNNFRYQGSTGCVTSSNTAFQWSVADCTGHFYYMCQRENASRLSNKMYFLGGSPGVTWTKAQSSCRQQGGDLASVLSQQEQGEFDVVRNSNNEDLWTGLYWNTTTNSWNWSNGDTFQICKSNASNCCFVNQTFQTGSNSAENRNCNAQHHFACYKETPISTSPTSQSTSRPELQNTASSSSPGSTAQTSGEEYDLLFCNMNKTWIEALKYCRDHNSTLVHITSGAVQTRVSQLLRNLSAPSSVWVGLERSYLSCRGPWFWTGGQEVTYSKWYVNFTATPPTHYCGKVVRNNTDTGTLLWHDACCEDQLPFICQNTTA